MDVAAGSGALAGLSAPYLRLEFTVASLRSMSAIPSLGLRMPSSPAGKHALPLGRPVAAAGMEGGGAAAVGFRFALVRMAGGGRRHDQYGRKGQAHLSKHIRPPLGSRVFRPCLPLPKRKLVHLPPKQKRCR